MLLLSLHTKSSNSFAGTYICSSFMISVVCVRLHLILTHCFLSPAVPQKSIFAHDSLRPLVSHTSDFNHPVLKIFFLLTDKNIPLKFKKRTVEDGMKMELQFVSMADCAGPQPHVK